MLIDIEKTIENLSCDVETLGLDGYEHMDTLWSSNVENAVFSKIIERLQQVEA